MEESLSHRTLKNALWQVFNLGWVTILNFFVTPILLKNLGIETYGVYVLILTVFSFLALLDLGMGAGFVNAMVAARSSHDDALEQKTLGTFLFFWGIVGIIGLLFFLVDPAFLANALRVPSYMLPDVRMAFYLAGAYFAITAVSSVFAGLMIALQRFDVMGKIIFVQNTILNLCLITVTRFFPSIRFLLAAHLCAAVLTVCLYVLYTRRIDPKLRFVPIFSRDVFFKNISFSVFNAVNGVANASLLQVDRFFVSRSLGPVFLSYYAIPNNLSQKIYSVSTNASTTLFPVAAALSRNEDKERLVSGFRRSMRLTLIFSVLSGTVLLAFGYSLLRHWVGQAIADQSTPLLYFFIPTYVLLGMYMVLSNFYLGMGKSRLLSFFSASMAIVNIVLLILLIPRYGMMGAAAAYCFAVMPVVALMLFFERRELSVRDAHRIYIPLALKLGIVASSFFLFSQFVLTRFAVNLAATLAIIVGSFFAIMGLYWILGFVDKEDKELAVAFAHNFLGALRIMGHRDK